MRRLHLPVLIPSTVRTALPPGPLPKGTAVGTLFFGSAMGGGLGNAPAFLPSPACPPPRGKRKLTARPEAQPLHVAPRPCRAGRSRRCVHPAHRCQPPVGQRGRA